MLNATALSQVARLLKAYALSDRNLKEFLRDAVGRDAADEIIGLVDRIRSADEAVKAARAAGVSPAVWLASKLGEMGLDIDSVANGMLGRVGSEGALSGARAIFAAAFSALGIDEDEPGPAVADKAVDAEVGGLVGEFFQSPLGSAVERAITAIMAAVLGPQAKARGVGMPALVGAIDLGLQAAKIGFKFAAGELPDLETAAELLEDRIAAHVAAMAGHFFEKSAPVAGELLGAALEQYVPMGGVAIKAGRYLGVLAGKAGRPVVEQGVKSVVRFVAQKARQAAGKLANTVANTVKAKVATLFG